MVKTQKSSAHGSINSSMVELRTQPQKMRLQFTPKLELLITTEVTLLCIFILILRQM